MVSQSLGIRPKNRNVRQTEANGKGGEKINTVIHQGGAPVYL